MDEVKVEKIKPTFADERGIITDILSIPLKHVCIITSRKGSVRGNHYHKEQTQYTYVLSGKVEVTTKDIREENPVAKSVVVGEGSLVTIPAMVIHKYVGVEDYAILAFTTEHRVDDGYEADTFRVQI